MGSKSLVKIAFYPGHHSMLRNEIFDLDSDFAKNMGGLPTVDGWAALKKFLAKKGIEINTYDTYQNFKEIDYWMFFNPSRRHYLFLLKYFINPRKVLFYIYEPDVTNPWAWKYLRWYLPLHKIFLSWSSNLAKKYPKKFVECKEPVAFTREKHGHFLSKKKKNLCLLMQSNKISKVQGELYSLRRQVIRYFEKRGDRLLDLYGFGWNAQIPSTNIHTIQGTEPFYTDLYKGVAPDKWETLSEYWFAFSIPNCCHPGDFEFETFMAMATGTVPIYLPPPNVDEYLPRDTYINFNDFKNLDDLVVYLQSIVGTDRYEQYREAGWNFINSEKYKPFTVEQFCEDAYKAIQKLIGK